MVRDNPLSLHITALNKMGVGQKRTINVSLSSRFIETTTLPKNKKILKDNFDLSKKLINKLSLNKKLSVEKTSGVQEFYLRKLVLMILRIL